VPGRPVAADAPAAELLEAYKDKIDELKAQGGYVTADVIDVFPHTPNLDAMLNKFSSEHWHDEDEVRFIVEGRGLFHIHPQDGAVFAIEVEAAISFACRGAPTTGSTSARIGASGRSGCFRMRRMDAALHAERRGPELSARLLRACVLSTDPADDASRRSRVIADPASGIRVVLLDIEGTTTPISFVHETLFAFARAHLDDYLAHHWRDSTLQAIVRKLADRTRRRTGHATDWKTAAMTTRVRPPRRTFAG
jgi:hypothetical protein